MSSETSTKRRTASTSTFASPKRRRNPPASPKPRSGEGGPDAAREDATAFQPWHLFVIVTLFASSAAAVAVRGTSPANVVFVCLTVMAAGVAAFAVYRTLMPLVQPGGVEVPEMLGGRTRAALEREKTLVLRAIKELEFDRAMGKVSEADWQEMTGRLRARAVRLIRQLDSGSAVYRDLIERELSAREASAGTRTGNGAAKTGSSVVVALVVGGLLFGAGSANAQMGGMGGGVAGMPDAKAMSGIARPSETVPTGSVSVRLVRGQLSNLITDHPVEFSVDGKPQVVKTDATGHAVVSGLAPGTSVQASATVDGERVQSQEFQVPAQGGVVLMLVATDKTAQQQMARDAVPGTVVLGGQSRAIVQFEDEVLQVYYLLDLVNNAGAPVKTPGPIVFEMPSGAQNTSVIEGSSPQATAKGPRVTVNGPFAPGSTSVQIAFQLPPGDTARIRLALPVDYLQPAVIVDKVGAMGLSSAQLPTIREANDGGRPFVMGLGQALKAGQTLSFDVTGIPHHPTWPRNLALGLALVAIGVGAGAAVRRGRTSGEAAARQALEARRETIFAELLEVERRRKQADAADDELEGQRAALVAELEKIYGELDSASPGARVEEGFPA
jgi:hypothetical protein